MAEQRNKTRSLLLSVDGKKTRLELFPAEEWAEHNPGENLFRVRLNGRWHSPMGQYSFLTMPAIGNLAATILAGGEVAEMPEPPAWMVKGAEVRVFYGVCAQGLPVRYHAYVEDEPQPAPDGRTYVLCHLYGKGKRFVPVEDVQPHPRLAQKTAQKDDKNRAGLCAKKTARR